MIKKHIGIASLSAFATIANAEIIKISIENAAIKDTVPVTIHNAQIRLNSSNDWEDLGDIQPGKNVYTVDSTKSDTIGVLRGTLNKGKNIVTSFKKDANSLITIKIDNISAYTTAYSNNAHSNNNSSLVGNQNNADALISIAHNDVSPITEYSGNLMDTNSWSGMCYGITLVGGGINCVINSRPQISYDGAGGGGGGFISWGTFSSDLSALKLLSVQKSSWGGGGLIYVHYDFWDQAGAKVVWYNGGGFGGGGSGGTGIFEWL